MKMTKFQMAVQEVMNLYDDLNGASATEMGNVVRVLNEQVKEIANRYGFDAVELNATALQCHLTKEAIPEDEKPEPKKPEKYEIKVLVNPEKRGVKTPEITPLKRGGKTPPKTSPNVDKDPSKMTKFERACVEIQELHDMVGSMQENFGGRDSDLWKIMQDKEWEIGIKYGVNPNVATKCNADKEVFDRPIPEIEPDGTYEFYCDDVRGARRKQIKVVEGGKAKNIDKDKNL